MLNTFNCVKYVQSFNFEKFGSIYQFECYIDQLSVNIKTHLISMLETLKIKEALENHHGQTIFKFLNSTKIGNNSKYHNFLRDFQKNHYYPEDINEMSKNYMYGDTEKLFFTSEKIYVFLKTEYDVERKHMCTQIEIRMNISDVTYI